MKKILTVLVAVMMGTAAFAQTWDHIGNPFTATDINGNTVSLADTLAAGKCVIIDYSCCWCNPCWNFHNAEILESICADATLGSQVSVMWVEIETSNTTAQITGTTTAQTYAGYTCGDWTNGGTVPYPIIDDDANMTCLRTCASLFEGSVPSIYFIAPNGYYCSIYGESYGLYTPPAMSLQTNLQNVANLIATYPRAGQLPVIDAFGPALAIAGTAANFGVDVLSVDEVTGITWTLTGATPATASNVATVSATYDTPGEYEVIVTVTNTTGSVSDTIAVSVRSFDYYYSFETANETSNWIFRDADGDGYGWMKSGASCNGDSAMSSASYINNIGALTPDNWMILPRFKVTSANASLTWMAGARDANYYEEHYSVLVSTTDTAMSSFTRTLFSGDNESAAYHMKTVSLGELEGKTIYIAFRHHDCRDIYWLEIDDIGLDGVTYSDPVSIENASNIEMSIYPNPASDYVMVKAEGVREINVLDLNGRVLSTTTQSKVDLSNLSAGVYFVRVITDNGTATEKIVKE
jgi:hypothetical protein